MPVGLKTFFYERSDQFESGFRAWEITHGYESKVDFQVFTEVGHFPISEAFIKLMDYFVVFS